MRLCKVRRWNRDTGGWGWEFQIQALSFPYCETLDGTSNILSLNVPSVKSNAVSSYLTGLL